MISLKHVRTMSLMITFIILFGFFPNPYLNALSVDSYPEANTIISDLKTTHPSQNHPRILATEADFDRVRSKLQSESEMEEWYLQLKAKTDAKLHNPLPQYVLPDGVRLLDTSRKVLEEIKGLGLMYQIHRDSDPIIAQVYVGRAWAILNAAGQFTDWNPNHFLDVAEMTAAFAIGYDWMYDAWDNNQKESIRNSILVHGLDPALQVYRKEVSGPFNWNHTGWLDATSNWNTVVNGGIVMGALAIADEGPELEAISGEIVQESFKSIQHIFPMFEPDGSTDEGTSYWNYNVTYLVNYLSSLQSSLGTDYGLSDKPGVDQTAYFPIYLSGPFDVPFNYGNSWKDPVASPTIFWLSKQFNEPRLAWYQQSLLEKSSGKLADPLDLIWYDEEFVVKPDLPKDKTFQRVKVGSMRSAWNDPNAFFVGFKGGDNMFGHNHMDLGTFVIDALGVRWASELGGDNYNLPGNKDQYYRIRPEGQNTLVINPDQSAGQKTDAKADIIASGFSPDQAFIITDLSDAYSRHATEVKRGLSLFDHRRKALLQDEIKLKEPGEIFWFMHTDQDIELVDGGKSAILTYNDRRLLAKIVSPGNESFQIRDSVPLTTSPNPPGQAVNTQSKLTVHAEGVDELNLSILFVPLMDWEDTNVETPELSKLDDWQVGTEVLPLLTGITVGGESLVNFDPETFTYYAGIMNDIPVVEASAQNELNVTVYPATQLPGVSKITVQASDGTGPITEYRLYFESPLGPDFPVSSSADDGNSPENVLDGDLNTRWSAQSGEDLEGNRSPQWIQFKLPEEKTLDKIEIAFFNGHLRQNIFEIEVSTDRLNWTTVFNGMSSGTTSQLGTFELEPAIPANYLRFVGYGTNEVNGFWNSISEIRFDGMPVIEKPLRLAVVNIDLDQSSILQKQTMQLHVQAVMNDSSTLDLEQASVRYLSSDPDIASVDELGLITGKKSGTVQLSVEVLYDGIVKTASETLSVGYVASKDDKVAIADAQVSEHVNFKDQNYGSANDLVVKQDLAGNERRTYLKFDLGELDGKISKATLNVHAWVNDSQGDEMDILVYGVADSTWGEHTLTWSNQPSRTNWSSDPIGSIPVIKQEGWREADITDYLNEYHSEGGIVSLALVQEFGVWGLSTLIKSRETDNAPYLSITIGEPDDQTVGIRTVLSGPSTVSPEQLVVIGFHLEELEYMSLSAIYAQDITFSYDPELLEFVEVHPAAEGLEVVPEIDNDTPGELRIMVVSQGEEFGVTSDGKQFELVFKALSPAGSATATVAVVLAEMADGNSNIIRAETGTIDIRIANVDVTELNNLINEVHQLVYFAEEGPWRSQYKIGSKDALREANDIATVVAEDDQASKEQIEQAYSALQQALDVFAEKLNDFAEGDIDGDGAVNVGDLGIVAARYGNNSTDEHWWQIKFADLNGDGEINIFDLSIVAREMFK